MTAQMESSAKLFEQVLDNVRKSVETNLQTQQEFFRQCAQAWPTGGQGANLPWAEGVQRWQKQWSTGVTDMLRKHRETLDRQYKENIEALEDAFRVAQSQDPEEFSRRAQELCRKSLDLVKELGERQVREFQEAVGSWMALASKMTP